MTHTGRWTVMTVLGLCGTVIFLLPFLREIYYQPLQQALKLTNTQTGMLMTAFGLSSMIAYVPGGWVADRVAPHILISLSLICTGLLGFGFATFPSYGVALAIHALWGITVTGMMWGALIKATRDWAPAEEQGRAFGFFEAGRGLSEAAISSGFLIVFAWLGGGAEAFASVIVQFSILHIALGIVAWRVLRTGKSTTDSKASATMDEMLAVLRMPEVWLIAIVLMTGYCAYWGAYYFTPYASDVFMLSVVTAGAIGAGKTWLKPFTSIAAGMIADRIGIGRSVAACFVVLIASFALFATLPGTPTLLALMLVNIVVASLAIFAMRGIYFALLAESGIPAAATGTAAGIVSIIGFAPDVFMPLVGGTLLDRFPGEPGYRIFFGVIAALCAVGLGAALVLGRLNRGAAALLAEEA